MMKFILNSIKYLLIFFVSQIQIIILFLFKNSILNLYHLIVSCYVNQQIRYIEKFISKFHSPRASKLFSIFYSHVHMLLWVPSWVMGVFRVTTDDKSLYLTHVPWARPSKVCYMPIDSRTDTTSKNHKRVLKIQNRHGTWVIFI